MRSMEERLPDGDNKEEKEDVLGEAEGLHVSIGVSKTF